MEHGNAYNWEEKEYWCEDCEQVWVLPDNMDIVVKFQRRKHEG